MHRAVWWLVVVLAWAAIGGAGYYWWRQQRAEREAPPPPAPAAATPAQPEAQVEPPIRHPIEAAKEQGTEESAKETSPLPPLSDSDKLVQDSLAGLAGRDSLEAFLNTTGLVRRVVATVDNLPRKKAPEKMWPVKPTAGRFATTPKDGEVFLDPDNYRRYEPFLALMEAVDTRKLVVLYIRFYPLFQQAYEELGYSKRYFNDRLIEAIDDLLATPEVKGPIKLARPWIMYEYANAGLEASSAGQKILIRMGSENAARVKGKLREIRQQVTRQAVTQ